VRGEKQEPFKGCFNRRYAAVNVSYEYEKRAFSKAWEGRGPRTMTAAHHLTAVLAIGVARLSSSNRIAADPPNAASIVAIERRAPNVDSSRPECANCVENSD
jgi:hypothetical protein